MKKTGSGAGSARGSCPRATAAARRPVCRWLASTAWRGRVAKFIKHYGRKRTFVWTTIIAWGGAAFFQYLCSFTLEADERKIRERGGGGADVPVARHSWLAKQSSADLESEFRDAADETTSLLHRRDRDAAAPSPPSFPRRGRHARGASPS